MRKRRLASSSCTTKVLYTTLLKPPTSTQPRGKSVHAGTFTDTCFVLSSAPFFTQVGQRHGGGHSFIAFILYSQPKPEETRRHWGSCWDIFMVPLSLDSPLLEQVSVVVVWEDTIACLQAWAHSPQAVAAGVSFRWGAETQKNCQCGRHGWILHWHLWQWNNKSLSRDLKRLKTMKYLSPGFSLHVTLSTSEEQVASKMNHFYKLWHVCGCSCTTGEGSPSQ